MGSSSSERLMFYLLLGLFIVPLCLSQLHAPDAFKALYSGRYIAQFAELPHHSSFTFSPVKDVFAAERFNWLGNLSLYGIHRLGGASALQFLRLGLVVFFVLIVHSIVNFRVQPLLLVVFSAMVLGAHQKFLVRTALWSVALGPLLVWLWFHFRVKQQAGWILGIGVLFLFWANIHGSYLVGLGVFGLMVLGDTGDTVIRPDHPGWRWPAVGWGTILCLLIVVSFVKPAPDFTALDRAYRFLDRSGSSIESLWNPSGDRNAKQPHVSVSNDGQHLPVKPGQPSNRPEGTIGTSQQSLLNTGGFYRFLERLRSMLQSSIFETDRPTAAGKDFPLAPCDLFSFGVVGFLFSLLGLGSFLATPWQTRLSELLPFLALSIIGLGYVRTVAYIPLMAVPLLFLKARRGDFNRIRMGKAIPISSMIVFALFLCHFLFHLYFNQLNHFTRGYLNVGLGKSDRYSEQVPDYLLSQARGEHIYNQYVLGTYLIWKWSPHKKVFVDGKSLAYKSGFIRRYYGDTSTPPGEKSGLNRVVLSIHDEIVYAYYIPHPKWTVEAFDRGMIVLHQSDSNEMTAPISKGLLYDEDEFQMLSTENRKFLRTVKTFIQRYGNDKRYLNRFQSPFDPSPDRSD